MMTLMPPATKIPTADRSTATIRVGAVSYLNARPLVEDLEGFSDRIELSLEYPSHLSDRMKAGLVDVGLIPVIEYFRGDRYKLIRDIAIGSRGPVLSVTMFSRVPFADIRTLALDEGSRTSATLAKILLTYRYGVRPETRLLPLDADAETLPTDAVLLIGDRAMKACLPGYPYAMDLGEEWTEWTGLPMVFAVWAVRPEVDLGEVEGALHAAKAHGMRRAGIIAQREAPHLGLDAGFCRRYLSNVIRYDLGEREEAGLRKYYEFACELGLAPAGADLAYYG